MFKEMKENVQYLQLNGNKTIIYQNIWNVATVVLKKNL